MGTGYTDERYNCTKENHGTDIITPCRVRRIAWVRPGLNTPPSFWRVLKAPPPLAEIAYACACSYKVSSRHSCMNVRPNDYGVMHRIIWSSDPASGRERVGERWDPRQERLLLRTVWLQAETSSSYLEWSTTRWRGSARHIVPRHLGQRQPSGERPRRLHSVTARPGQFPPNAVESQEVDPLFKRLKSSDQ